MWPCAWGFVNLPAMQPHGGRGTQYTSKYT